jgi:hypothetical protein
LVARVVVHVAARRSNVEAQDQPAEDVMQFFSSSEE